MGPNPPVDEYSVQTFPDDVPKFLENPAVQAKLATTKRLSEVKAADYDAVFYIGGHGPVLDLPQDPENIKLASDFWRSGKLTTAVCHGPAALVNVTDARGESIFKGRRATAFADEEEQLMHAEKVSGRNLGSSIDIQRREVQVRRTKSGSVSKLMGKKPSLRPREQLGECRPRPARIVLAGDEQ